MARNDNSQEKVDQEQVNQDKAVEADPNAPDKPETETDNPSEMTSAQLDAQGFPLGHYLNPMPQAHDLERLARLGR